MPSKNKPRGDPKRIGTKGGLNTKPKKGPPNPLSQPRRHGERKITHKQFQEKVAFGQLTHDVPAIAAEDKKVEEKEVFAK